MAFTIDFKILKNSIVNGNTNEDIKEDRNDPFSFIDFVKKLNVQNVSNDFVVDVYNRYLIEWSKIKKQPADTFASQRKQKYIDLLKTIQINYVTQDEERILDNLDYDNPLELEVAIPFFVEKIKDIIEYYSNKRSQVKSSKAKWSTKGSLQFLKNTVAEYIITNYTKDDRTFQRYKQDYQELSSFQSQFLIEYRGLYDIKNYAQNEVSINNEDFLKTEDDYVLSSLPISAFSDYNRSSSTLVSELKKKLFKKYVSLDNTYYAATTSVDIDSETPFHDTVNLSAPLISRISTTDDLLTQEEIGYYFTSRFIMASKYISPNGISLKDTENFVGLLPKLNVYYQVDYVDYYFWSKYDPSYLAMSNKPVKNKRLKRFYGYESKNTRVGDNSGGVNRYTDNIQFWSGSKNSQWANDDIFDKFKNNILNRNEKESSFFNLDDNEGVYKYSVDIFGNEYYLIKEKEEPETTSNNIYPLRTFTGGEESANFILLGQRLRNVDPLSAVEIEDDLALGFNISQTVEDVVDSLGDFHLNDKEYYTLDSSGFNTSTIPVTSLNTGKSIYEYGLTEGKLIIRTADSKQIENYVEFVDDVFSAYSGLYSQLSSNIIEFDITGDMIIISTSDYTLTHKIEFNYTTSTLTFNELNKNVFSHYNDPLNKSAKYWNDSNTNSVYFANISATDDYIIPSIKKLMVENNTIVDIDINSIPTSSYQHTHPIELESISKPNVVKKEQELYIITLLRDICGNNFFNLIEFEEIRPSVVQLKNNTLYNQSQLLLNEDILSSDSLTSFHSEILTSLSSDLVYYSDDELTKEPIPEFNSDTYDYYDNDQGAIISKTKPTLEYNISDIATTLLDSSITTDEETYIFDTEKIYVPSDITLDITNLSSFSTYIPNTEHIIKIEYDFGTELIIRNISNENQKGTLYDLTFTVSPLNQIPYVYNNNSGSGLNYITVKLYSASNKVYNFEFQIDQWVIDVPNRFSKIELLDSRINVTDSGNNMVLYLNSRSPDYLIPLKLINI